MLFDLDDCCYLEWLANEKWGFLGKGCVKYPPHEGNILNFKPTKRGKIREGVGLFFAPPEEGAFKTRWIFGKDQVR